MQNKRSFRKLAGVLSALTLVCANGYGQCPGRPLHMPGDVTKDGVVTAADLIALADFFMGAYATDNISNLDVNGSCCINQADLSYLTDFLFSGGPAPADCTCPFPGIETGDLNQDGVIDASDLAFLTAYLAGGPAPGQRSYADVDGDCCVTAADQAYLTAFLFTGGPAPVLCTCAEPVFRPGDANSSGTYTVLDLSYLSSFYSGGPAPTPESQGDANGDCCLDVADQSYLTDYLFAGGPTPPVCVCPYPHHKNADLNRSNSFTALDITALVTLREGGSIPDILADADVTCDGYITVDDVRYLTAYIYMGGPAPVSPGCGCPALVPNYCCLLPGDADASRDFNIGDVTFVVNFIFTSGTAPECYDEADADSSNDITIGDVTSMIAYIFGSGPAPSCGGRGF